MLDQVAERYPVVLHGVSMSIGSTDPLDREYLRKLKALAKRVRAHWVSDHLCWTGVAGRNVHDLLPMPYTEEALRHTTARVRQVSEILERPLILENPSSYVEFKDSLDDGVGVPQPARARTPTAACSSTSTTSTSAPSTTASIRRRYIDAIPADRVVQYHLAGHTNKGTHIVDTHSDHAIQEVWDLYGRSCRRTGNVATLYEWDENIPEFEVMHAEALKAGAFREQAVLAAAR